MNGKTLRIRPGENASLLLDDGHGRERIYPVVSSAKKFSAQLGKPSVNEERKTGRIR